MILQGELNLAEETLNKAIAVAQKQAARSLELRATFSLASLFQQKGKVVQARECLTRVYDWFSEGFENWDLLQVGNLLQHLPYAYLCEPLNYLLQSWFSNTEVRMIKAL